MADESTIWERLAEPFAENQVKVRVQTVVAKRDQQTNRYPDNSIGMAIHYIDARNVMQRLDDVLGPENWCDEYSPGSQVVECRLSLRVSGEWITKADVGYPNGKASAEPFKDAYSDALKRAAVKWGIGRFLYDMTALKVKVDPHGNIKTIVGPMDAKTTQEDLPPDASKRAQRKADADSMAGLKHEFAEMMRLAADRGSLDDVKRELGDPADADAALAAYSERPEEQRAVVRLIAEGAKEA